MSATRLPLNFRRQELYGLKFFSLVTKWLSLYRCSEHADTNRLIHWTDKF